MKQIPKEEALRLTKHIGFPESQHEWQFVDERYDDTTNWKKTHDVLAFEPYSRSQYLCGMDVGYGWLIVWDLGNKKVYHSATGHAIVEENFAFVSNYYGFPQGAFYKRTE